MLRKSLGVALAAVLPVVPVTASSQAAYPDKPIRMVVPLPPGGGADFLARLLAEQLGKDQGWNVIIENRGGAGGSIGSNHVAQATPDGYTLVFGYSASHSINPVISSLPYDPVADFTPVTLAAFAPNMLVVNSDLPARSVKELIELARSKPGALRYASAGTGSAPHMSGELFNHMAGTQMIHVPYKGAGPALVDVIGGHVELTFTSLPAGLPHARKGAVRMLAVTGSKRASLLPDLPTVAESGLPGFDTDQWYGVLGPKGLPPAVVARLHEAVAKALQAPELKTKAQEQGFELAGEPAEVFQRHLESELAKWRKLAKDANIQPQ